MTAPSLLTPPGGWIRLYRCIQKNPMWQEKPFDRARAWIDLLLLANFEDSYLVKRGIKITVKRGQVGWSERNLSERWGWSRGKIRRFLDELKTEQQIEPQNGPQNPNITSLICITNYERYQSDEPQKRPQNGPQTVPQTVPWRRSKEEKTYTYSDCFEELWKIYPSKDGRKAAFKHFTSTVKNEADCQRIRKALNNYLDHLKAETWKKPKNGATWFNNWQDWEHWTPPADQADEDLFKGVIL